MQGLLRLPERNRQRDEDRLPEYLRDPRLRREFGFHHGDIPLGAGRERGLFDMYQGSELRGMQDLLREFHGTPVRGLPVLQNGLQYEIRDDKRPATVIWTGERISFPVSF